MHIVKVESNKKIEFNLYGKNKLYINIDLIKQCYTIISS